jgi:hypothetical protein
MDIDWEIAKKHTLWSYEDLIKKLISVLAYRFVQEHYNHSMEQALDYAERIRRGYLQNQGNMVGYVNSIAAQLEKLDRQQIGSYSELVQRVATRERCATFLQGTGFEFGDLIETLNYLLRWVLPFKTPLREFFETDNPVELRYLGALKVKKIGSNLDLLEAGRTAAGRAELASAIEMPLDEMTALVHRADISRLAYVRGKTVKHLCGGGYDTLERIANADVAEMEEKMDAYYRSLGKRLADFKSVIPLWWMIGGAKILPRVVMD